VEFSPDENFILSFNNTILYAPDSDNYIVWNVQAGDKIREFKAEANEAWNIFNWSSDSKFIAKVGENKVSVYEMPYMNLIKDDKGLKTSIPLNGVNKVYFVPKTSLLMCICFTKENGEGARIVVIDVILFYLFFFR
jgi:uncharacterized protein with WD repeat